jgi:hypothetical protein
MKISFLLAGILIILLGMFLTMGILVYSLKENDNYGFFGFIISFSLIGFGIALLVKAKKIKT